MPHTLTIETITPAALTATLSRYTSTVPASLTALETARLRTIPAAVAARRSSSAGAHITAAELATLVAWKLGRGRWRPNLAAKTARNGSAEVASASGRAFALAGRGERRRALAALMALRGVGPATASLLLAEADPVAWPFFADELWRWAHWDARPRKKGAGWTRPILYNERPYWSLVERVDEARRRLRGEGRETTALELEMVAYVLGKEGVDVEKPVGDEEEGEEPAAGEEQRAEKPVTEGKEETEMAVEESARKSTNEAGDEKKQKPEKLEKPITERKEKTEKAGKENSRKRKNEAGDEKAKGEKQRRKSR